MAQLNTLYNQGANTTQLPNGGGTYSAPTVTPLFPNTQSTPAMAQPRSKYINPETGKYFTTPEEYGNYVATKIPVSSDVPKTAGDAMTKPNQSVNELTTTATNLNNARNDIATGTTDPYQVGNTSGIAYSPAELKAIEKAYAGIYDPALNDVFARLKDKEIADKEEADRQAKIEERKYDKEMEIFKTNEAIRQWRATTGTKGESGTDLFTQTQLNTGARNAGMSIDGFSKLDEDLQNYFISPPKALDEITGKTSTIDSNFKEDIAAVEKGDKTVQEVTDAIEGSNLAEAVKHYYIDQLPLNDVEKQGYFSKIWGAITGQ